MLFSPSACTLVYSHWEQGKMERREWLQVTKLLPNCGIVASGLGDPGSLYVLPREQVLKPH